jgi:hypothetical protein
MLSRYDRPETRRGQALVEAALVLPLFIAVVAAVIVFGLGLFYQQQITNAAREAARYAAVHSATAQCPTSSWQGVNGGMVPESTILGDLNCDPASTQWPLMRDHGRERAGFGFDENALHFAACWSGYVDPVSGHDAPPFRADGTENDWADCTIGGIDPVLNTNALTCPPPPTTAADDKASNLAVSSGGTANQVTVYACYEWHPPLAGFLLIPETISMRATISESMQHQR